MKILQIHIIENADKPLLNDLLLEFPTNKSEDTFNPNIFIGINGSGKSQLLETIADIFLYLDRVYRQVNKILSPFTSVLFDIHYTISLNKKDFQVNFKHTDKKDREPELVIKDASGKIVAVPFEEVNKFLPLKVIGYTSGENETLSLPFTDYYDEYARYTAKRARLEKTETLDDYEPRFYLMDYNTNIGVVISNLVLGQKSKVKKLTDYIGISALRSFQIVIQTRHTAAPKKNKVELTAELEDWIEKLKKASTCHQYFKTENKYVLDFYVNDATRAALLALFKTPLALYTALYKIELLNNLIIKDSHLAEIKRKRSLRKLIIKPPTVAEQDKVLSYSEVKLNLDNGDVIDYLNLSDGEHQLMNISGTILMSGFENSLFLLDEPETHFNPMWRREFISLLSKLTSSKSQDYFLTSHSPFIVADIKREYVYVFKRVKNELTVEWPLNETYGSDYDSILQSAFELESSLSKKSFDEMQSLLKNGTLQELEDGIKEFGESGEKFFLFKKLQDLKNKDVNSKEK
ncbi:restriction system-associated AAA family ATPase [Pedobacter borealis]|uniref:restriction system-associated AAA family ATPase n=1 Tax=Pedobacter borealis TaxID=475254 RepID=UPI0004935C2A|nr:restriction system-associated AAA family ATPase [Pedobacter borealis]